MTAYCAVQDLIDRHGDDELLLLADRNRDGEMDADVLDQAIADAADEIDAYVAARYPLPLATVPGVLLRVACDIVVYRLAVTADLETEERRKRYDDAVKFLTALSRGDTALGIPSPPSTVSNQVHSSGNPRIMTRSSLKGVL